MSELIEFKSNDEADGIRKGHYVGYIAGLKRAKELLLEQRPPQVSAGDLPPEMIAQFGHNERMIDAIDSEIKRATDE